MEYKHTEIIQSLSKIFDNLSDPIRKKLLGKKIDNIITPYFDRITSEQVASCLLSKYGSDLFNKKHQVLETIISGADKVELIQLAKEFKISVDSDNIWDELVEKSDNAKNLPIFLKHYNLPEYFLASKIKDDREVSEKIILKYNQNLLSLGYPHDYQNLIKLELIERINKNAGKFSALVAMPTGSGKTRTAIEFIIDFIRNRKKANIMWLVESPELAEQALQTFKSLWLLRGDRELTVHRCYNKFTPSINFNENVNILFSAFQKLNGEKKKNSTLFNSIKSNTHLLVIDEAHYSLAETYDDIISSIKNNSEDIITIGLTATPMRPDDTEFYGLKDYFNNLVIDFKDNNDNIIENPLLYLQEKGYLAQIEVEYLAIDSDEIKEESFDFNYKVIERIKSSVLENKQIIVFAMSKDHAVALDILLKHQNIKSSCIIGDTLTQERQTFFKDFQNKKINVLINFDILSTGIDLPKVDELFLLRKFGQLTTAMQVLGRALRGKENGGNEKNKVISIIKNKEKIHNANDLYNLINNMYN
jgi:DNA repair protein RadD